MSQKNKRKKPACPYCGNNPVNHTLYRIESVMENAFDSLSFITDRLNSPWADRVAHMALKPIIWLTGIAGLWRYHDDIDKSRSDRSRVIWEEALRRKIPMQGIIAFGRPIEQYRAYVNERWHHFHSIPVPPFLDKSAYKWIDDKGKLREFLAEHTLPVAYGKHVRSWREALAVFRHGEPPYIVKPRIGSRGRHTTTHIYTEQQLKEAYTIARQLSDDVIVEEHLIGSVYRTTYVGGKVYGALRGEPPRIIGDGKSSVRQLIERKNKTKHPNVREFVITDHTVDFLRRQHITLRTVLPKGKSIDLTEKIGISYGGFAAEDAAAAHPKILRYIKRAGDALGGPVIGFDYIIENITKDPDKQRWGIIEANSLPFIDLHHHPLEGKPINVAAAVWDLWKVRK